LFFFLTVLKFFYLFLTKPSSPQATKITIGKNGLI